MEREVEEVAAMVVEGGRDLVGGQAERLEALQEELPARLAAHHRLPLPWDSGSLYLPGTCEL